MYNGGAADKWTDTNLYWEWQYPVTKYKVQGAREKGNVTTELFVIEKL